ncbi:MAG: hypothetical protein QOG88_184 [Actinomycetota bacterium]|jgi:hypothetical protein|nr:hypothetical protein [Actinomycetota bacterium]
MRRGLKIVGWVAAFSACFAVGAVIAAHSDPFPPGVTDPGATATATTGSPSPVGSTLIGTVHVQTVHNLYVGGACRTNWKGSLELQEDAEGSVTGTGTFDLLGSLHCDFAVIQAQTKTINVGVTGSVSGKRVTLSLTEAGRDPKGTNDFGGLAHTLRFLKLSVPLGDLQQVHASRSDLDRGTYTATGTFTVACSANCAKR